MSEPRETSGDCQCALCDALTGNSRYEVLRRLSPREFADLFARNLVGENFDAMVDQLRKQKEKAAR